MTSRRDSPAENVRPLDTTTLPVPLASFVGRDAEIVAVRAALLSDSVRLLTLIGPGGVGKTRLAVRAAEDMRGAFADGVVFVPLAAVRDPALVASEIAQTLGVPEVSGRPLADSLAWHLRDRSMLLLLDNFEQVLPAAPLINALLAAAPAVRVLVTSRSVLRLYGEYDILIPPLSLPDSGAHWAFEDATRSEAVRLFVERARAANSSFHLTAANTPVIAEVCRRLDGLPLAIELAAARITVLPLEAMLARMEQRLPLLTGGPRDQPARLRTMRNAIAWSCDLLTGDEQMLFRWLAVFVGGFTLEAAVAVCTAGAHDGAVAKRDEAQILDAIASLVDQSLVFQIERPNGETRYGMLEMVREFGLEQLVASGEEEVTRDAHASWCVGLAERFWESLVTLSFFEWLDRVAVDVDNLRAALAWLDQIGDTTGVLRLAGSLGEFWLFQNLRQEGRGWLERTLEPARSADVPATIRARALRSAGWLATNRGEPDRGLAMGTECLLLWEALDERQNIALAHHLLGGATMAQGDYDRAVAHCEAAEAIFDALGNAWWVAGVRSDVHGRAVHGQGDSATAIAILESSLAMYQQLPDPLNTAYTLTYLGFIACDRGDRAAAASRFAAALPLWQQLGTREMQAVWLAGVASLAASRGEWERAARLFGAADGMRDALGHAFALPERVMFERAAAGARAALGDTGFAEAWTAGSNQPLDRILTEASELLILVEETPPTKPRGAAYNTELTSRERDVLRLLVAGRADKEIAEALFIGMRTVQTHTDNIYAKLGVRNRHEATAVAVRRGLA